MDTTIAPRAAARLRRRAPLPVDPRRAIAIKRDVHRFEVGAPPERLAEAFREVMEDPAGRFGLIRVKRPEGRVGQRFALGERFQGCFSLAGALDGLCGRSAWLRPLARALGWCLRTRAGRWLAGVVEDQLLSDYGEIEELCLDPDPAKGEVHRLRYRYLDGTPIRGSSTFIIEPAGGGRSTLTQVFEYQEVNAIALWTFQRLGLKLHDQVVAMQAARAATRAGAEVLSGTVPEAYARLFGGR
jgi:hypothetical protein